VVPVPGLVPLAVGVGGRDAATVHGDDKLVRPFAQLGGGNGGGVLVATRGAHPVAMVPVAGDEPEEELHRVRRGEVHHAGAELGFAPRQVGRRGQRGDDEWQGVRWRRVVLRQADRAYVLRERGGVHRAGGAQQVDA